MGFLDKLRGKKKNDERTLADPSDFLKDVTWITTNDGERLPTKLAFTVDNIIKKEVYTFYFKLNPYFEYTTFIDSVSEVIDFCFGGDLITITYSIKFNGSSQNFEVDYNIIDAAVYEQIADQTQKIMTVQLGNSPYYKHPSNIVIDNLNLEGDVPDLINKQMLSHCLIFDNSLFLDAKVGKKLKADIKKVPQAAFSDDFAKKGVYDLKVEKIEFISKLRIPECRKEYLMVENIHVFRDR